jgi:selenocysteine-specific elongation factor
VRVVATAGHVDHGKSTLVRALTGMEPDRLAEERRRRLSIELGYAWTTLADGGPVAFVDVPGHQRFIGNMLAGVGPAPAVLFVVAADEGWQPQSEEHLAAIDALGIRHGLLAITRSDLADPAPARREAEARLGRSSLGAVEAIAVSGVTGEGLPELRAALQRLVRAVPAPDPTARARLWVDRVFTIHGSGTVVTGTLESGAIRLGDRLDLGGRTAPVRGLQSLGEPRDRVAAVARVAVNLRGLSPTDISRGDALVTPAAWHWGSVLDVRLDGGERLPNEVILHLGTAAIPARLRPFAPGLGRVALSRPVPAQVGDRAILRDPGARTLIGARVLDVDPPALRRRGDAARRALDLAGDLDARAEIHRRGAVRRDELVAFGLSLESLTDVRQIGEWLISDRAWNDWLTRLPAAVEHQTTVGVPIDALRRELGAPDRQVAAELAHAAGLRISAGRVVDPARRASLGAAEGSIQMVIDALNRVPFGAPERDELARLGLGRKELAAAEAAGRLVRISDDIVLRPDGPSAAADLLRRLPQPFTASQARQALGSTRRVVIPLLEYLDRHGYTDRVDAHSRRIREVTPGN